MKPFYLLNPREKFQFIFKCRHKTLLEKLAWLVDAVFHKIYYKVGIYTFLKKFYNEDIKSFDFKGVVFPFEKSFYNLFYIVFNDTFYIHCYMNDDYSRANCEYLDCFAPDGPFCYKDENIEVLVKPGDVVIDAGAFVGDFSALAAYYGAEVYAFEPVSSTYETLCKTSNHYKGAIKPVKMGLGDKTEDAFIGSDELDAANSILSANTKKNDKTESIKLITLDDFVKRNNINKVDFIKSDIEGFERNLLIGAREVLKKFAPKLAICTYHLPDDPEVLERLILEANPDYKVVHLRHKLYAAVPGKE